MLPYSYYNKDDNIHKAREYVTQDNISDGQTNLDKHKVAVVSLLLEYEQKFNVKIMWLTNLSEGCGIRTYLVFVAQHNKNILTDGHFRKKKI